MDIVKSIRIKLPVKRNLSAQNKVQILDFENDLLLTCEEPNLAPLIEKAINSMTPSGVWNDPAVPPVLPSYSYIDLHDFPTVTDGSFTKPPIVPVP